VRSRAVFKTRSAASDNGTTDALTPEQNRKEQEQRIELCARVAAAVR
jgi:hypothetical protein